MTKPPEITASPSNDNERTLVSLRECAELLRDIGAALYGERYDKTKLIKRIDDLADMLDAKAKETEAGARG